MKKKAISFLIAVMAAIPAVAQKALPVDPSIRKGTLSNGMTYYIRHNDQTPNVAEFYIAQRVGSILEEPRQRGLAHFLEHMAFNGTKNFPGAEKGGLREWCESKGIKFGANLNAYTSVDQTVYNISSAPVNKAGVVDTCLLILHDWSHYLLLKDDEIDKERGVIHEEWRTRRAGMAGQRLMEQAVPVIYQGTKYEDCWPIGNMDIVDNFPYKDLRDYYHKWYRPDLQAIIVVGDIDVNTIEQKIKRTFGDIPKPQNPAKRIYYPVNDNQHMIIFARQDKEQPTCNFTLYMKREGTPRNQRNNNGYSRDGYVGDLMVDMLRERLSDIVKKNDPPFLSASARDGQFFISNTKDAFTLTSMLKQDRIREGILAVVGEAERARQHGFLQSELDRAKAEQLRIAEYRFNQSKKNRNSHYVNICLNNFLENEPMITEADELALIKQLNEQVTLEEVNKATREAITDRNQVVTIFAPKQGDFLLPSDTDIESYIFTAQQQEYAPYQEKAIRTQLITDMPKRGTISEEAEGTNGYREFTLSNGMHVYVRKTDFEPDRIMMNVFSLGGKSIYPDNDMASLAYLSTTITGSGIGDFDQSELNKALSGKTIRISPFVNSDTEGIQGSCSVKDFETLLQLTYLYFTQPRRDEQAFNSLMNRQESFLTNREANPNVSYNDSITAIVYGNHPRLKPMKKDRLGEVSLDRIMQIYQERFSDASDFNVIITGNVDEDKLKPLMEQYLASLPSKYVKEEIIDRKIDVRPVDETHAFRKHQTTPSALTNIFYTARLPYTAENDLKLSVLCQIMRMVYTEKVREEKGGTYGVSVTGSMVKHPYDEALLKINFRTDPDKYDDLIPIIYEQMQLMAQNGPSADDLQKIKEYELKSYEQNIVTNGYWDYVKYNKLFNGIDFDKDYKQLVNNLTPADIQDFCKQLIAPKHRIQVTMLPEE